MKKRRLLPWLCTAALSVCCCCAAASAASAYPDLPQSHWAYSYMDRAAQYKILLGLGDGRMAPDEELTWAQCLTIAARTFAPEDYAAAQGESWDAQAYNACVSAGILLEPGEEFLDVSADPASLARPITRQDTAVLLERAIPQEVTGKRTAYDYETWQQVALVASETLADFYSAPQTHWASEERLFDLEIVQGSPAQDWEGNDILLFNGDDILRRADGATLFLRALDKADGIHYGEKKTVTIHVVDDQGTPLLDPATVETSVGYSVTTAAEGVTDGAQALHYYTLYPEDQFYVSDSQTISTICADYTLVYYPMSEMERARQDFFDAVLRGEMSYEDYWWQPFNRYELGENDLKHYILFGDREKRRYSSQSEAKAGQTTVTVPLWRIDKNGDKYATQGSFQINAALADDVVNLFTEIFNDPERFPIKDLGGYGWRGDSATGEHNCGTAIDINPNENYQIRDGQVLVGSLWSPGKNPCSIGPNSSVVRIFVEHGWSWGGDAWAYNSDSSTGYHDYMHFSYMGG